MQKIQIKVKKRNNINAADCCKKYQNKGPKK